jgi:hypothetical protein
MNSNMLGRKRNADRAHNHDNIVDKKEEGELITNDGSRRQHHLDKYYGGKRENRDRSTERDREREVPFDKSEKYKRGDYNVPRNKNSFYQKEEHTFHGDNRSKFPSSHHYSEGNYYEGDNYNPRRHRNHIKTEEYKNYDKRDDEYKSRSDRQRGKNSFEKDTRDDERAYSSRDRDSHKIRDPRHKERDTSSGIPSNISVTKRYSRRNENSNYHQRSYSPPSDEDVNFRRHSPRDSENNSSKKNERSAPIRRRLGLRSRNEQSNRISNSDFLIVLPKNYFRYIDENSSHLMREVNIINIFI